MLKQKLHHFHANSKWALLCDSCNSVPSTIYCRLDSVYLCTVCDTQIHQVPSSQDHERVWKCEACEQAPAVLLCKADAASLCASCDADIHSANPLANRHHRVPILPVGTHRLYAPHDREADDQAIINGKRDEDDAASWLLPNTAACKYNGTSQGNIPSNRFGLDGEVDQFMGLFEFNSGVENEFCNELNQNKDEFCVPEKNCGGDSVVPVEFGEGKENHYQSFLFGMEFETKPEYSYNPTISQSVSVYSLDVGVVPECSVIHSRPPKGNMEMGSQVLSLEREARVMRYREKKKKRRSEKRIRYASRKAYSEMRPRIKGRFAKTRDVQVEFHEIDPQFTTIRNDTGTEW